MLFHSVRNLKADLAWLESEVIKQLLTPNFLLLTMPNLAYTRTGEGFPVVFLHGFCESKEIWQEFTIPLMDTFGIITVDMPGFGESTGNTNYQTVDQMAAEVDKLLDELSITQAVIVAHSLGGYVGLALAEQHPEKISGLCLFHSTAFPDSEEKKQSRNKTADFIDRNDVPAFIENFVPPLFYRDRHDELRGAIEKTRQITLKTPKETAIAAIKAMRDRPDRTHVLKAASYPVLFIAGKEDEAVPFEKASAQFFLPKHSVVLALNETAHMGMFEQTEETQLMVEYFARLCLLQPPKPAAG